MKINIKSKRLSVTDAISQYFQEKMDMLDKFLGDMKVINCDVEIEKVAPGQNKGDIYRAEVNIQVPGSLLRVEKTEKDLYKAIDKVKDHLERVIKKYREKERSKRRVK